VTGPPASVSKTGAVLDGALGSSVGGQVQYWVQYGPTTSYGSISTPQFVDTTKNVGVAVEVTLDGLTASTPYHYRLCARDSEMGSKYCGADATFTTQSVACDETVTTDVKLTGNLKCNTDVGIRVGADDVDVDLGGYTLQGSDPFIALGGVEVNGHDGVVVHDGRIEQFSQSVFIRGSGGVVHDVVARCGPGGAIGVSGNDIQVTGNDVRCSGTESVVSAVGNRIEISNNTMLNLGSENGVVLRGDDARITGNQVQLLIGAQEGLSRGLDVQGSRWTISGNTVSEWHGGNIYLVGSGTLSGNEVFAGGRGQDFTNVSGPGGDGIFVNGFSANVLLSGNNAHNNRGDGIEVQATSARLGSNTARGNSDFGIDAAGGVTDLGGNTASGNGNVLQCRNVFCGASP
jgi:parallel beta-helix repeat protein